MTRPAWIGTVVLTLGLAGCGDDSPPGTGSGSSSSGAATTDTSTSGSGANITTGTSSGGGGQSSSSGNETSSTGMADDTTEGSTGEDPACENCLIEECNTELEMCVPDKDCACWLECTDNEINTDAECMMMCGPPPPTWDDVLACAVETTDVDGACFDVCVDPCNACVLIECQKEFDACVADVDCTCVLDCDDEMQDCEMLCGVPPATWDAFAQCYATEVGPGGACEPVCEG